jgi:RNA polymerase primary sigma factor
MAKPISRHVRANRTSVRPSQKRHLRRNRAEVRAEPAVGEAKILSLPVPRNDITAPDLSDLIERGRDSVSAKPKAKAKVKSAAASDDHLTTYFRDLAEHDLLGPEDERELSQGIEDQEVLTWERLLGHPDAVVRVVEIVAAQLEQPVVFDKLLRAAEVVRGKRKDTRSVKKLGVAAREVAERMRALDLDRVHVDAVVRDLEKARAAAQRGEAGWIQNASTKSFGEYLESVHAAHRDGAELRDEFVRANLRLVVTMARRYDRGGMPLADLIQEGNLGLMHAVSRFDYRRGLRFSTYACWWIRHAIGRALADKARAVRIPVHMLEAQQQLEKVRQALIGELGRPPSPQELAKAARVPLAKLNQMHRYIMGQPMSLDRPVHDDDDRAFGDLLADPATEDASPADDMTTQALSKQVTRLLHHLTPIEADVLRKRFGLKDDEERTFREIGDEYHLSRERIRQIQNAALDKLKRAIEREHHGALDI